MTPGSISRRPPLASAAIVLAVLLLFGAATFVAGLAVAGGGPGVGQPAGSVRASPSVQPSVEPTPTPTPTPTPGPTPILETVTCSAPSEAFALLCETYAQIKADYVDEISDEELVEGAVEGMVESLADPYSGYLPAEQYEQALGDLSGEFSGIGAEVGMRNLADPDDLESCTSITETCVLVIIAPLDGSPAEAAGLRAGDIVRAVDGEPTAGSTINEQVFRVRGEEGTDVTLTVERDGRELGVTITRAVIELQELESELLGDGIGYVRLSSFTSRATDLFREALAGLFEQGATSIVFDLRGNPGGFLDAADGVAGQFVPAGSLLFTVESGDDVDRYESDPGGLAQTGAIEVVVLVDGGTASASEIVAAALQENERATLVGEPTFGKNTVQIWRDLPNGGGLRLTTDRWFTPEHNSAAPDGIQPDIVVEAPDDPDADADADPQLDRAVELLGG
ncbi:MAG: S41 family peptidase [Candidatus Limnocylindria bacterium]